MKFEDDLTREDIETISLSKQVSEKGEAKDE